MPYLDHMPWRAVDAYFKSSDCVLLGAGAIHGHDHIPLGIDNLTTEYLIKEVEKRTGLLLVPNLPFSPVPDYMDYPGTISVTNATFVGMLTDVTDALFKWGARRFFIINGHGHNTAPLTEVAHRLRRMGALAPIFEWWRMVKGIDPEIEKAAASVPATADRNRRVRTRGVETAAAMFLSPQAMSTDSIRVIYGAELFGEPFTSAFQNGVVYKGVTIPLPLRAREALADGEVGTNATAEQGKKMLGLVAEFIVDFVRDFRKAPLPGPWDDAGGQTGPRPH